MTAADIAARASHRSGSVAYWVCSCGQHNAIGVKTCPCGRSASSLDAGVPRRIYPFLANPRQAGQPIAQDRAGATGRVKTRATREARLQAACEAWLASQGIEYLHLSPRAREKRGWPDLTFSIGGRACAVELKSATGQLSQDQAELLARLVSNGWLVKVCRELSEFTEWVRKQMEG